MWACVYRAVITLGGAALSVESLQRLGRSGWRLSYEDYLNDKYDVHYVCAIARFT